MFKKFPWKTVLLTLIAWALFWEIKETIAGERVFFVLRWLYSDIGHAKNIEVLSYLLTDEQVAEMLSHPNEEIQQPSSKDLWMKNVNVVFRIRNVTRGIAIGRLAWTMPKRMTYWNIVDVHEIAVPGKDPKYSDVIIPAGIAVAVQNGPLPLIEFKWTELYVQR
jgi:hypothetical protein